MSKLPDNLSVIPINVESLKPMIELRDQIIETINIFKTYVTYLKWDNVIVEEMSLGRFHQMVSNEIQSVSANLISIEISKRIKDESAKDPISDTSGDKTNKANKKTRTDKQNL